jgi:hypothetical protein
LVGAAFSCSELWRRRQPVQVLEEFDLSVFNEYAPRPSPAGTFSDLELQPWEKSFEFVTNEFVVSEIDFSTEFQLPLSFQGQATSIAAATCHGVVLWIEISLTNSSFESSLKLGVDMRGDGHRQGLWLFTQPKTVSVGETLQTALKLSPATASQAGGGDFREILRGGVAEPAWEFLWG